MWRQMAKRKSYYDAYTEYCRSLEEQATLQNIVTKP